MAYKAATNKYLLILKNYNEKEERILFLKLII